MMLLDPDSLRYIVIHGSASFYGDVDTFNEWHKDRGWNGIGYHWVITNVYPTYADYKTKRPRLEYDGRIWPGREEKYVGAHVYGHNRESIGVCMVGNEGLYSANQIRSCARLCTEIQLRYPTISQIKGHYEYTSHKTCPTLDMEYIRVQFGLLQGEADEEIVASIARLSSAGGV
jgi:hypothetical protein